MVSIHNDLIKYRPEIDGLRAVAVLPVIFFHAGFETFSGGFVGVDIFFVISGYLITSIVLRELELNSFSIARFYERRARRILPALFVVLTLTMPFAWLWMLPDELKRFGQSLIAVVLFSSNVYFWRNTDYFAPSAEQQPLLHTWSLAVEEQYYLLFPLILMFAWRMGKRKLLLGLVGVTVLSFILAEWLSTAASVASFFLLHTRAWELLLGSVLAFIPSVYLNKVRSTLVAEIAVLVGLCLIVYSIAAFDSNTPFPGFFSLFPTVGTVLLIIFSSNKNLIGRTLSSRLLVGVGLISYSAYLWHQPLFAFFRLVADPHEKPVAMILLCAITLALAKLTTEYVEKPIREQRFLFSKSDKLFKFSLFGLIAFLLVGLTFTLSNGYVGLAHQIASRQTAQMGNERWPYWQNELCNIKYPFENKIGGWWFCMLKRDEPIDVYLLGNSHANDLYAAFDRANGLQHLNVLSAGTCSFLADPVIGRDAIKGNPCEGEARIRQYAYTNEILRESRPSFVFMNVSYPANLSHENLEGFVAKAMKRAIQVRDLGLIPVVVLPRPKLGIYHVKECFPRPFFQNTKTCEVPRETAMAGLHPLNNLLLEHSKKVGGIKTLSQEDFFCNETVCKFMSNEMPLIRDDDVEHLSLYGAELFGEYIVNWAQSELPSLLER